MERYEGENEEKEKERSGLSIKLISRYSHSSSLCVRFKAPTRHRYTLCVHLPIVKISHRKEYLSKGVLGRKIRLLPNEIASCKPACAHMYLRDIKYISFRYLLT